MTSPRTLAAARRRTRAAFDLARYLVKNRVVIRLEVHEAARHLSRYLDLLSEEERIVLCRRNVPIAEIRLLQSARTNPRPVGLAKGRFEVPPEFFEPLPDDQLDAFEGKGS